MKAEIINHNNEQWVLFSALLEEAGGLDSTAANRHADALGIERATLPHNRQKKYIRLADVPRLLSRYKKPTPDAAKLLEELGYPPDMLPEKPSPQPDKLPEKQASQPVKKNGQSVGKEWWEKAGKWMGDFYASPLFAYVGLTLLIVAQAWLHASGVQRRIPTIPPFEAAVLAVLMQSVVLIGTVNSKRFFGGDNDDKKYWWESGYWRFIVAFFIYDALMGGCNFFSGYDPATLLDASATWAVKITAITDLGFRVGLSLGFPAATVFFAALVKKISLK